jgi:hypothetical protein
VNARVVVYWVAAIVAGLLQADPAFIVGLLVLGRIELLAGDDQRKDRDHHAKPLAPRLWRNGSTQ